MLISKRHNTNKTWYKKRKKQKNLKMYLSRMGKVEIVKKILIEKKKKKNDDIN